MQLNVYRVYDAKIKAYLPPIFERTHEGAIRIFGHAASDPNHAFGKYPEDYYLFFVGIDDDTTGLIENVQHEPLGNALQHRQADAMRAEFLEGREPVFEMTNGKPVLKEAADNG